MSTLNNEEQEIFDDAEVHIDQNDEIVSDVDNGIQKGPDTNISAKKRNSKPKSNFIRFNSLTTIFGHNILLVPTKNIPC